MDKLRSLAGKEAIEGTVFKVYMVVVNKTTCSCLLPVVARSLLDYVEPVSYASMFTDFNDI